MVAHAGHNIGTSFIPDPPNDPNHLKPLIDAVLYAVAAIAVIGASNNRTLTRKSSMTQDGVPPG
jgi:hypothetical protein